MPLTYGELLKQLQALDLPDDAPVRWLHMRPQPQRGIFPIQSTVRSVSNVLRNGETPNACYLVEEEVFAYATPPNVEEARRIVEGNES
jgi:hypothetical protein